MEYSFVFIFFILFGVIFVPILLFNMMKKVGYKFSKQIEKHLIIMLQSEKISNETKQFFHRELQQVLVEISNSDETKKMISDKIINELNQIDDKKLKKIIEDKVVALIVEESVKTTIRKYQEPKKNNFQKQVIPGKNKFIYY